MDVAFLFKKVMKAKAGCQVEILEPKQGLLMTCNEWVDECVREISK
jgi:hypothetical protein